MRFEIKKESGSGYICTVFNNVDDLIWQSNQLMSSTEVRRVLIEEFGFHQLDVFEELFRLDPENYPTDIARRIELAKVAVERNEGRGNQLLVQQLKAWLRIQGVD